MRDPEALGTDPRVPNDVEIVHDFQGSPASERDPDAMNDKLDVGFGEHALPKTSSVDPELPSIIDHHVQLLGQSERDHSIRRPKVRPHAHTFHERLNAAFDGLDPQSRQHPRHYGFVDFTCVCRHPIKAHERVLLDADHGSAVLGRYDVAFHTHVIQIRRCRRVDDVQVHFVPVKVSIVRIRAVGIQAQGEIVDLEDPRSMRHQARAMEGRLAVHDHPISVPQSSCDGPSGLDHPVDVFRIGRWLVFG